MFKADDLIYLLKCTILYTINNKKKYANKRYSIIDQQIAWHFVDYTVNDFKFPLSFSVTQIINTFLNSRNSANHEKWLGF
jgi:hypothetical protein